MKFLVVKIRGNLFKVSPTFCSIESVVITFQRQLNQENDFALFFSWKLKLRNGFLKLSSS